MAGNHRTGRPPVFETLRAALAAIKSGMSQREAAKRFELDRGTIRKYSNQPILRRKSRRCPECGALVHMPCLLCSEEVQDAAERLARRRRQKALAAG